MSARNPKHENVFLDTNIILEPLIVSACGKEYVVVNDSNDNMINYSFREKNGRVSLYKDDIRVFSLKRKNLNSPIASSY